MNRWMQLNDDNDSDDVYDHDRGVMIMMVMMMIMMTMMIMIIRCTSHSLIILPPSISSWQARTSMPMWTGRRITRPVRSSGGLMIDDTTYCIIIIIIIIITMIIMLLLLQTHWEHLEHREYGCASQDPTHPVRTHYRVHPGAECGRSGLEDGTFVLIYLPDTTLYG